MANINVIPLESNPEIMTAFLRKFGVPPNWSIVDVEDLESGLCSVTRPVLAVILVFPFTQKYEEFKTRHEKKQKFYKYWACPNVNPNLFFVKQDPNNSGGAMALIHGVANNLDKIALSEGTFKNYVVEATGKTADAKAELLETKYIGILHAHMELAQEGQTNIPEPEVVSHHHFVTFVHNCGILYELDGLRPYPVNHGPTAPDCLLEDVATVIKGFIARDPNEIRFSVLALSPTPATARE